MFNLLVSFDPTAWETENTMQMQADRFHEYSGTDAEGISRRDPASLKALEGIPTLLMYENAESNLEIVRYGVLKNIKLAKGAVSFNFEPKGYFPKQLVQDFQKRLGVDDMEFYRTHWAIKNGDIPRDITRPMTSGPYKQHLYDVVLSFAGEQREYVERLANFLKARNVNVFYDRHQEADLWGKELSEELDIIYSEDGRYCVMFVSKEYAEKMWTRQERRSAFERAMTQLTEYILPVRFDDTEVPGLRKTVGFLDATTKTPEQLGKVVLQKLGRKVDE